MPFLATSLGLTILTILFCQTPQELKADISKISNYKLNSTMNWFSKKVPALIAAISIMLIAALSCRKQDSETVVDNLRITTSNALYLNPLNIQVIDAADETDYPATATVTIVGKDKGKLLSVLGETKIPMKNGLVELGVLPLYKPSAAHPLEFSVLIQAAGYLDALKCFKITDAATPRQEVMKIFKITNLPDGVQYSTKQAGLDAQKRVTSDVTISSPGSQALSMTLQQGTILYDKNRNALSGSVVKMTLIRFDASQETAVEGLPGGAPFCGATDNAGRKLGDGAFTAFGFYNLSMTVNGVAVKSFSIPLKVSMTIPITIKRTVNSADGSANPVRSEDKLPVWSLNEQTQQWTFETMATASSGSRITFDQSHLSSWNVADPSSRDLYVWLRDGQVGPVPASVNAPPCSNAGVRIQSDLPNAPASQFYVKVLDAVNTQIILGAFYSDLSSNAVLDLAPYVGGSGKKVRLAIYESEGGTNLHQTGEIDPCNRPFLNLTNHVIRPNNSFTFIIDMNALCRSGNQVNNILPTSNIYFADMENTNKPRWRYLGRMVDGKLSARRLIKGRKYQFLLGTGPLYATTAQLGFPTMIFPINNSACTVRFQNATWGLNQDVTAFASGNDSYLLSLPNFIAPAILCDKYSQFF
jgi:hypothetical protein